MMVQPVRKPPGLLLFFINETGADIQMGHFPEFWLQMWTAEILSSVWQNRSGCPLCFYVSVSVQIMQPYCPCYQFLSPFFQNPSYLPACYLFACLLIYHLLCHFDLHVVLWGSGGGAADVFTGGLTRLPQPLIISDRSGLRFPGFLSTNGALDVFFTNWT